LISTGLDLDWTVTSRQAVKSIAAELALLAADYEAGSAHLHAPCLADAVWSIPTIATAHSCMASWWDAVHGASPPREIAFHRDATAAGLVEADAIIAPSHSFANALSTLYSVSRPIHVIHNGLAPFTRPGTEPRREFILAAGRLWDEGKNLATLDLAAADCVLSIHAAGSVEAPHGGELRARHLKLLGKLPNADLRALAGEAAAFASPSLYEPFGLAVLEAAQAGTPLVLADIPTFRELWDGAAVFVPAHDANAWAATMNTLATNLGWREELGHAARVRAGRYTQSAMVEATLALHEKARVHRVEAA
jgi:glycosyltransferase involved in cell wall biosynthesis